MLPAYWIVPDTLAAGPYPGSVRRSETVARLRRLLEAGCRAFVDLTEPGEPTWLGPLMPYEAVLGELGETLGDAVHYQRFPVVDQGVPPPDTMTAILDRLDAHRHAGRPAYVHCLGGKGRTGTVVGCFLVRHAHELLGSLQEPGPAALDTIVRLRREQGIPDPWDSPQTEPQMQMVLGWQPGR